MHMSEDKNSLHVFALEVWPSEVRTHEKKQTKRRQRQKIENEKEKIPKKGREISDSQKYCLPRFTVSQERLYRHSTSFIFSLSVFLTPHEH